MNQNEQLFQDIKTLVDLGTFELEGEISVYMEVLGMAVDQMTPEQIAEIYTKVMALVEDSLDQEEVSRFFDTSDSEDFQEALGEIIDRLKSCA